MVTAAALLLPANLATGMSSQNSAHSIRAFDQNWTRLSSPLHPSNRNNMALAYDARDGFVVGFGGQNGVKGVGRLINETWTFSGGTWTKLNLSVVPPLSNPTYMAYDDGTGQVILLTSSGAANEQTWAFSGGSWSRLHPLHSPPAGGGLMTYDPAVGDLILDTTVRHANGTWVPETWAYGQGDWKNLSLSQTPRVDAAGFAYDPEYRGVLLIGYATGPPYPQVATWLYRNGSWVTMNTSNQPSLLGNVGYQGMVYDGNGRSLLLVNSVFSRGSEHTWSFKSGTWRNLSPDVDPSARFNFGLTYDARDRYVVQFGGFDSSFFDQNQTWTF